MEMSADHKHNDLMGDIDSKLKLIRAIVGRNKTAKVLQRLKKGLSELTRNHYQPGDYVLYDEYPAGSLAPARSTQRAGRVHSWSSAR